MHYNSHAPQGTSELDVRYSDCGGAAHCEAAVLQGALRDAVEEGVQAALDKVRSFLHLLPYLCAMLLRRQCRAALDK